LLQCREKGDGSNDSIATIAFSVFLFSYSATKKATRVALLSPFSFCFVAT